MTSNTPDLAKYQAAVEAYAAVRDHYRILDAIVERVLKRATSELGVEAIIQVRAKALASFAEKTLRKQMHYTDPLSLMTDLCGARVITESTNDVAPVCAFIRRHFGSTSPTPRTPWCAWVWASSVIARCTSSSP